MAFLTLGKDIQSLRVQRSLNDATHTLSKNFERLSTGLRINSASDDAAGIAIADSLRTNARLYTGAVRNVNDGISALNIIDGTLTSQSNILTRLIELSEQSANGTFSEDQRRSLNTEYRALVAEFGRLGDSTKFNNINLLLGGHGSSNPSQLLLQAGVTGSSASSIQITTADTGTLSGTINPEDFAPSTISSGMTLEQLMTAASGMGMLHTLTDSSGISRDVYIFITGSTGMVPPGIRIAAYMRGSDSNGATSLNPNLWVSSTGGSGSLDFSTSGEATSNLQINITGFSGGATAAVSLDAKGLRLGSSIDAVTTHSGRTTAISFTGVETASRARAALDVTRRRLEELSNIKGSFGALQSRLEVARSVSEIAREGSLSAESHIRDADIASETASLVAAQIRQQTATSILGQLGQGSEILLSLLKA